MPDHDLRLVMAPVNHPYSSRSWIGYMAGQTRMAILVNRKGTTADGSCHFLRVLKESSGTNSTWIAYITSDPNPHPEQCVNFDAIKMFVTVTSNTGALITSHMGIAASVNGVENGPRGLSVDLHSFAAKVMLMMNPNCKYMVNAPVAAMAQILIKALPEGSVFVGTRDLKDSVLNTIKQRYQIIKEREHISFADFIASKEGQQTKEQTKESLEQAYASFKEPGLPSNVSSLTNTIFSFLDPSKELKSPSQIIERLLKYWEKTPPVLSVVKVKCPWHYDKSFEIYDPEHPTAPPFTTGPVADGDTYTWLNSGPFLPAGNTIYVVVDLNKLANAKHLGKLKA